MKRLLVLFIVLLAAGSLVVAGRLRSSATAETQPTTQSPATQPPATPSTATSSTTSPAAVNPVNEEIPLITVAELKKKIDSHEPLIVLDVSEHTGLVIRDAMQIPLSKIDESLAKLPKDRLIVTVCGCHAEASSSAAARLLRERGYSKLAILKGGQIAWDEARYPVDMLFDDGHRVPDDRKEQK